MGFNVETDITKAKTIDTNFLFSEDFFQQSKEKIFSNSLQFIGDADSVKEKGWVTPINLLETFLDEPLVISKDKNEKLHCLSNVCTHRGNLIVEQPCKLNDIRCKYHGRRFQLDGKFLSMPEFKEVKNFPTPADDLHQLPLHTWGDRKSTRLN